MSSRAQYRDSRRPILFDDDDHTHQQSHPNGHRKETQVVG
jgi:hypothetical protein